jgi:hypothetical protein
MRGIKNPYKLMPLFIFCSLAGCTSTTLIRYEETHSLMDTFITAIVYSPNETIAQESVVVDAVSGKHWKR